MPKEIPYHIPGLFKRGMWVKVARRVPQAHAWHADWTSESDKMVGKMVRVLSTNEIKGYLCKNRGGLESWLPSTALDVQRGGSAVIEVPSVEGT